MPTFVLVPLASAQRFYTGPCETWMLTPEAARVARRMAMSSEDGDARVDRGPRSLRPVPPGTGRMGFHAWCYVVRQMAHIP